MCAHDRKTRQTSQAKTRMPFGKFKGIPLCDLPDDYLEWLSQLDNLRQPLLSAVLDEIKNRELQEGDVALWLDESDIPIAREIIDRGRRAAASVHHPDRGGSTRTMQKFNQVALS